MADRLRRAFELVELFEKASGLKEAEAVELLAEIFRACGCEVQNQGFIGGDRRADCYIQTEIGGRLQHILAEIVSDTQPVGAESIEQAFGLLEAAPFAARSMVIARGGFSLAAIELAESNGPGRIDLLSPLGPQKLALEV